MTARRLGPHVRSDRFDETAAQDDRAGGDRRAGGVTIRAPRMAYAKGASARRPPGDEEKAAMRVMPESARMRYGLAMKRSKSA